MLAACSAVSGAGPECATDDDCDGGACSEGTCIDVGDVSPLDTGEPDGVDALPDTQPVDGGDDTEPDTADAEVDTEGPCVGFGCPCETHAECGAGFCIDSADGRVCTVPCVDICPVEDWECRLVVGTGGDVLQICVPTDEILCNPCEADIDCGTLNDRCLPQADGTFCARDCAATRECPEGYDCESVETGAGGGDTVWQCVPSVGVCGACLDLDGDGHGVGPECLGGDCDDLDVSVFDGAPEVCDTLDNDCDEAEDEDFVLATDLRHCGACNAECDPANADSIECIEGQCTIHTCDDGWADCNDDVTDGCEIHLDSSLENCGECFAACNLDWTDDHVCADGLCEVATCDLGHADCNEWDEDGCEIDTTSDADNCGFCENQCVLENTDAICVASECAVGLCADPSPWRDCNELPGDGCEVDIGTRLDNCGFCGFACNSTNVAAQSCEARACVISECVDDWGNCNGDPADGCERDLLTSLNHCGECDNLCSQPHAVSACQDGGCLVTDCATGWEDLDGNLQNGCNYECTFVVANDVPDDGFLDADCDGVDGNDELSVYVAPGGNNANPGTRTAPVATLAKAIELASASPTRKTILAASGAYGGGTLVVPGGVSIYGGYSGDFRSRSNAHARYASTANVALRVSGATSVVVFDRLDFSTPNQGSGGWTTTAIVENSGDNVRFFNCDLQAGNGGAGVSGSAGGAGATGGGGANAVGSVGGAGGSGGGGAGGLGREQNDGLPGGAGAANSSSGGAGGGGGDDTGCNDGDPTRGGDGGAGSVGTNGSNGAHGTAQGSLSGSAWSPANGADATDGGRGGGGGGGGAGGGEDCEVFGACVYCGTGRGGGGGGGGGAGGAGGNGGTSGGASIGLVINNSTVRVSGTLIDAGAGGSGGNGGNGGAGGAGGARGAGASDSDNTTGDGGWGGAGGNGGSGGCGGAGGGGPSVGVWGSGSARLIRGSGVEINQAGASAGGSNCAGSAPAGTSATSIGVTLE